MKRPIVIGDRDRQGFVRAYRDGLLVFVPTRVRRWKPYLLLHSGEVYRSLSSLSRATAIAFARQLYDWIEVHRDRLQAWGCCIDELGTRVYRETKWWHHCFSDSDWQQLQTWRDRFDAALERLKQQRRQQAQQLLQEGFCPHCHRPTIAMMVDCPHCHLPYDAFGVP
jgi:hypothetical protein